MIRSSLIRRSPFDAELLSSQKSTGLRLIAEGRTLACFLGKATSHPIHFDRRERHTIGFRFQRGAQLAIG
jgi:hypothetical protein